MATLDNFPALATTAQQHINNLRAQAEEARRRADIAARLNALAIDVLRGSDSVSSFASIAEQLYPEIFEERADLLVHLVGQLTKAPGKPERRAKAVAFLHSKGFANVQ